MWPCQRKPLPAGCRTIIYDCHTKSAFQLKIQYSLPSRPSTRKKDRPEKQVSPFVFKQCVAVLQHHNLLGKFAGAVQGLHEVDAFFVGAQVDFALRFDLALLDATACHVINIDIP